MEINLLTEVVTMETVLSRADCIGGTKAMNVVLYYYASIADPPAPPSVRRCLWEEVEDYPLWRTSRAVTQQSAIEIIGADVALRVNSHLKFLLDELCEGFVRTFLYRLPIKNC